MRFAAVFALAALLVAGSSTPSAAAGAVVEKTEMISILSGYHGIPDAGYWAGLDQEKARAVLRSIADDETLVNFVRARALQALRHVADKEAVAYIASRITGAKAAYVRSAAAESYSKIEGASAATLSAGLSDTDTMVRLMTAKGLKRLGTPEAMEALRGRLDVEENTVVRTILERELENAE